MMKFYKILFALFLALVVGCADNPCEKMAQVDESQTFALRLKFFSDEEIGNTRAGASETSIYRGFIFFYNSSTGAYKGYESFEGKTITQEGNILSFDVGSEYSTKDKVICVFNYDENAALPSDFSVVNGSNVDKYFPISASYLAEIQEDMNDKTYALGMPMCVNDFTDTDRAEREVFRSVARMEIFLMDGLTIDHDSHTHSFSTNDLRYELVNEISVGSVAYDAVSSSVAEVQAKENCFDANNFSGSYLNTLTSYSDTKPANDTDNKIYLNQFPYSTKTIAGKNLENDAYDKDRFSIILRHGDTNVNPGLPVHQYRYYKLNLLDKATGTYLDVKRNHNYRILIKAVNSRGYETLEEAIKMPPSNIEYEIFDDQGGLTLSNGQYAISMDEILNFDEVVVYGEDETILEFNNIRYVLPEAGQMAGADFTTNEVHFSIINNDQNLITSVSSDFTFDVNDRSVLTPDGKSISLTLKGEGECKIALKLKLGNLEMGRDDISIKKVSTNGAGNGVFDAHPEQITFENQEYIANSWQSDDLDFGARATKSAYNETEGSVVVYMGENATPTGFRTMDGFISGEHSVNSYPVFSPKTRKGYYSYRRDDGKIRKVMIQLEQLAPYYLGHFGNTSADAASTFHYNGLICEKIEEVDSCDYSNNVLNNRNGVMKWSEATQTYYTGDIYGDFKGMKRYLNLVDGLDITKNIVENNKSKPLPNAAHYCYMKNDINGNGIIEMNEPIVWYLPAQNQLLAMWINMNVFTKGDNLYKLNNGTDGVISVYYWSSSEADAWNTGNPGNFSNHAIGFNMLEGQSDYRPKMGNLTEQCHVRCVRGLN